MAATSRSQSSWPNLAALIIFGFLPVLAAAGRMVMRFGGVGVTAEMAADSARFFSMPAVVLVHVTAGCLFTLLGALQFFTPLRRKRWHRWSGRVLVIAGLLAALSALLLTQFYPHLESEGLLLYWFRLAAGLGMIWFLARGYQTARQGRFEQHRPNMMRAYALGLGASTQMLIGIPWMLLFGEPAPIVADLLLGAGWLINLAVVQWLLWRSTPRGGRLGPPQLRTAKA